MLVSGPRMRSRMILSTAPVKSALAENYDNIVAAPRTRKLKRSINFLEKFKEELRSNDGVS